MMMLTGRRRVVRLVLLLASCPLFGPTIWGVLVVDYNFHQLQQLLQEQEPPLVTKPRAATNNATRYPKSVALLSGLANRVVSKRDPGESGDHPVNRYGEIQKRQRISYRLLRNASSYRSVFNNWVRCIPEKRTPLSPDLQNTLGFTTEVSTDLKLLFLGDSVSIMNSQMFEEVAGGDENSHTVLRYSWGTHEGLHVNTHIRGGGVVAGWRITALMKASGRRERPFGNVPGGHWVGSDVDALLGRSYRYPGENSNNTNTTIGSFDAMILRIPHGWMKLPMITRDRLSEAIELAHTLFGVQNVVILTLPFINNVQNPRDLATLRETNTMIQEFSREHSANNDTSVDQILTLDFGRLGDALVAQNAVQMGYDTTSDDFLFDQCCEVKGFQRSIALTCAERVPTGSQRCQPNMFNMDGMHWCNESLNGRITAGVSCLLSCIYDSDNIGTSACAQGCNDRFMSLQPIEHFDDEPGGDELETTQ